MLLKIFTLSYKITKSCYDIMIQFKTLKLPVLNMLTTRKEHLLANELNIH